MLKHLCCNQQMWEISQSTIYLLSNIYKGSGKCRIVKTVWTTCRQGRQTSHVVNDITDELHKMTTQISHTNQSHKSVTQDGMMS